MEIKMKRMKRVCKRTLFCFEKRKRLIAQPNVLCDNGKKKE